MTQFLKINLLLLILVFIAGCLFDSDSTENPPEPIDKGTYKLEIKEKKILWSYPGGGGLYILVMTPGEDFEGKVQLSVYADPFYNARLTNESLSIGKLITEVTIRPNTTAPFEINPDSPVVDTLKVISMHAGIADTLKLVVYVSAPDYTGYPHSKTRQDEFARWLNTNHPVFGITTGQEWFAYNPNPAISI